MRAFYRFLVVILVAIASISYAESSSGGKRGITRVLPAGIAFPPTYHAASTNAATLAGVSQGSLIEGGYGPPLQTGDPERLEAAVAATGKRLGLGVEYSGTRTGSGPFTNGGAIGGGANFQPVSLGVGLRDANVESGFNPTVDLAIDFQPDSTGKDFHFGGVLYGVNGTPVLGAYAGFIKEMKYFLEGDVVTPPLSSAGGAYRLGVAAGVWVERFGFSFHTRFYTDTKTFDHTIGAALWVAPWWNLGVQIDTPRTLMARTVFTF